MNDLRFNFNEEDKAYYIEIKYNISSKDFYNSLMKKIDINILKELVLTSDLLVEGEKIIINKIDHSILQSKKGLFSYFTVGDKKFLVNHKERTYCLSVGNTLYLQDELTDDEKNEVYPIIKSILDSFLDYNETLYNIYFIDSIYTDLSLYNENRYRIIAFDENISLVLANFYEENFIWMNMNIVDNYTNEVVGSIEFNLTDDDCFSYKGNVSYIIKERYRRRGYATKALSLLKSYLDLKPHYKKDLYVSTQVDNVASQKVAINNGGTLVYEGKVPKSDTLYSIGKIREIKIYKV